ncbi:MAG: oxidoreductase [Bacteroidia bacterium]
MRTIKTALVTGASSGIGKSIAAQLLHEGYQVFVAARRIEQMQDLVELGATAIKMDITSESDIKAAMEQIKTSAEGVDILINNAGYAIYGAVEDTSIEDARRQFEVNIFGLAGLTQQVLPYMRSQKAGTIINISSVGGKIYTPLGAWYHATKHALEGWSDCLRLELQPFGIDVIIIEPGGILTEFAEVLSDPMMERSGKSAYSNMAKSVSKSTERMYSKESKISKPQVIADVVSKALRASKPKTRYAAGFMAKPILFFRWMLSDRMFDALIRSQIK